MKKKRIVFLLPNGGTLPIGGFKVVYEYANRLIAKDYDVHIVYPASLHFRKQTLKMQCKSIARYFYYWFTGKYSGMQWFGLNHCVKEHWVCSLHEIFVPKSDIYIATAVATSRYLNNYKGITNDQKFYLIQGFEQWGGETLETVTGTYHYPMKKIVISKWLKQIMDEERVKCELIPNGFDFSYFKMNIPIRDKNKYRVTMLNHFMKKKGCKYGFEALEMVKQVYPQLCVNLFGIGLRPEGLPEWYDYYQSPDRETHNRIYNEAAIFLGTSSMEGWGLTIGEAMICGQAVVCTDNPGYQEMAEDGKTALLSPIKDSEGLAKNIIRLIDDDALRCRIAEAGYRNIHRFTWEQAVEKLQSLIEQ